MIVKVCGITSREDALAAIEAGATALGFNFYAPSPRYLTPEAAGIIVAALPANILKVGVFVNEAPAEIERIMRIAGLDVAQLHGNERLADVPPGIRIWKAFRVTPSFSLDQLHDFTAEAFLLDTPSALYGGSGETFDWRLAAGARERVLLAGGLDESNVADAVRIARPWGVDACSRLEASPGRKDHGRMARFIAAALSA